MSDLRAALTGKDRLHNVDVASVDRGSVDLSVLYEPASSGAPLLADWYRRHQASPVTMFHDKQGSRRFLHTLVWRLVDVGFDPKTRWEWVEEKAPDLCPMGPGEGPVDLLDLMLEEGSPGLLSELERRWGEQWSTEFLSRRVRKYTRPQEPGMAPVVPWFHYAVARGDNEMVDWWMSRGVDINFRNRNGQTALFHASSLAMARRLLSKGADPKAVDMFGRNAFEHWLDRAYFLNSNEPSKPILGLAPKIRKDLDPSILARAVEREITAESKISTPLRRTLESLKPHILTPFRFGEDAEGKIYPTTPQRPASTLLELATHRSLEGFRAKNLQILGWLLAHTPTQGLEKVADRASFALLSSSPLSVYREEDQPLPKAMSFPYMIDVARDAFHDKQGVAFQVRDRIVPMLLDIGGCVLGCVSNQNTYLLANRYRNLVDPHNPNWFNESEDGGSLLSQVLSCAMDLADTQGRGLPGISIALARAMVAYVHSGLPVPRDTLLPVMRMLGHLSPDLVKGSALGSSKAPGETDMKSNSLALGAAWWLTAGTPVGEDMFEAAGASENFRNKMKEHLEKFQGPPWSEWMNMWESRRMARALPEFSSSSLAPRSRF